MICKICNCEEGEVIEATDFITKNNFEYWKCMNCDVIALKDIPKDYSKYYFNNYYSLVSPNVNSFNDKLKSLRDNYVFFGKGFLGSLISLFSVNYNIKSLRYLNLRKLSTLLDVGCGVGKEVYFLKKNGFENVYGIDPFIEKDIYFGKDKLVEKNDIYSINGSYDFITMHHSFEHVINPIAVMKKLKELISKNGTIMIRIPLSDSLAFEKYGSNWVQFDPPRHTFLHTKKSMKILCNREGLIISDCIYDSVSQQFWGSELTKKRICIHSLNKTKILYLKLLSFLNGDRKKAKKLNQTEQGDQAIFIIKKVTVY